MYVSDCEFESDYAHEYTTVRGSACFGVLIHPLESEQIVLKGLQLLYCYPQLASGPGPARANYLSCTDLFKNIKYNTTKSEIM